MLQVSPPRPVHAGPTTLFQRLWAEHAICDSLDHDHTLLRVDRHYLHDLGGGFAIRRLAASGHPLRRPDLTVAIDDHTVPTGPDSAMSNAAATRHRMRVDLREFSRQHEMHHFHMDDPGQGIVHIVGPEQGLTLPGLSVVCGDSHTSSHGALGALAWAIGTSEVVHVLATQAAWQRRPRQIRIVLEGRLGPGCTAKDAILSLIGRYGTSRASGAAIEFAGPGVREMDLDARFTLCNMASEFGAKFALSAPDSKVFDYLHERPCAPSAHAWDAALSYWRTLRSHDAARFDEELGLDLGTVEPQVSWGTHVDQVIGLSEQIPQLASLSAVQCQAAEAALSYMDLQPGQAMAGLPVDQVFIGSCTNGRISDLAVAAGVIRGRRVRAGVRAWVVPGSREVSREAERLGIAAAFRDAGFAWRSPGCSMCCAVNGETVAPGQRCVSTSNRNFAGRQGPRSRTHLASPPVAALAAVLGCIPSLREYQECFA
jgi:3-isopropylmalate/(R)-2-methylmalate dehydratase large subunit